jgi:hypothetical protein
MPGEKIGEYIHLFWDGGPEAFYVRGHIPALDAMEEIAKEVGDKYFFGLAEPIYGRYSCEHSRLEGIDQILKEYDSPGKGRFPIMRSKCLGVRPSWAKKIEKIHPRRT